MSSGLQLAETAPPGVNHPGADLVLLGDFRNRRPVRLPRDRDHLLFGESTLLHKLLAGQRESHSLKL